MYVAPFDDFSLWTLSAMRRDAHALITAGKWEQAARLARDAQHIATQSPEAGYFEILDRPVMARSPQDGPHEQVTLHLCSNLIETPEALAIPGFSGDPGQMIHARRRLFAHDGARGLAIGPAESVAEATACIDLTHVWATNWFHFLLEVVGGLARAEDLPAGATILVNQSVTEGPYLEALRLLVPELLERIAPAGYWGKVRCEALWQPRGVWMPAPYHADPARTDHHAAHLHDPEAARALFARALPDRPAQGRRIVLTRPATSRMRCENEAEMLALAEAEGFEAIAPETMPFAEQAAAFHDADVILGTSGAGFANLVFCRPGTRAIVLRDAESDSVTFGKLAEGLELELSYVDCPQTCPGPLRDYGRFRVDIGALRGMLG